MTPEITRVFERIKRAHGPASIQRVELMMNPKHQDGHQMEEGAKYVMAGASRRPWHDPYQYPQLLPIVRELEARHGAIKEEFTRVWTSRASSMDNYQHYLMTRNDWKALYIYRKG